MTFPFFSFFMFPFCFHFCFLVLFPYAVVGPWWIAPVCSPFVGSKSSSLPSPGRSPRACHPQLWMINILSFKICVTIFHYFSVFLFIFRHFPCFPLVFIAVQWFYQNTKMAHPGTSCPRKMKTAAITTFWMVGFFPSFPLRKIWKMSSRTSKPTVSHRNQQGVKRFWVARHFLGGCHGTLRWHIQARDSEKMKRSASKPPFSHMSAIWKSTYTWSFPHKTGAYILQMGAR